MPHLPQSHVAPSPEIGERHPDMANDSYPQKTCEIDQLVTHKKLVEAALAGRKTQQRRNGVYAHPGEIFDLKGTSFEVTGLERQTLGEMTDADARAEGYPSMAMYKDLILRMHAGMDWDESAKVWVHTFRKKDK